jgi:hypothetical protein
MENLVQNVGLIIPLALLMLIELVSDYKITEIEIFLEKVMGLLLRF